MATETTLKDALDYLEQERDISRDAIFAAIEDSLMKACKKLFLSTENIRIEIDKEECIYHVWAEKEVLSEEEVVRDDEIEISLEDARALKPDANVGDLIEVEVDPKKFSRIVTQDAKNVITQKLREEERATVYNQFAQKHREVVTGVIQRRVNKGWSVNLGKTDALLPDSETVPSEHLKTGSRVKVYVLEVKATTKGAKITVSRTHPELVKRLFEDEVTEIKDGTVEIMNIAREPGSRTKISVVSYNENVDPVGACVGVNGIRVNAIVNELYGEKIDIINWDENPGELIRNSLSPAKIVNVFANPEEKTANVVVPDNQLSLAIGKAGQNARLAAKLTGYKIDIKSETQAQDAFGFRLEDYMSDGEDEYYEEEYETEYSEEAASGEVFEEDPVESGSGETEE